MTGGEIGAENVINILKPEGTLTVHVLCCLTAKKKNPAEQKTSTTNTLVKTCWTSSVLHYYYSN